MNFRGIKIPIFPVSNLREIEESEAGEIWNAKKSELEQSHSYFVLAIHERCEEQS